jgi:hypothetical protein
MTDTDKYEGHSTGWKLKMNNSSATIWNDEGHKVATTHYYDSPSNRHDRFIIEDSLKLLAEVKRLREQLEWYEQYDICHPEGTHCCDECLERNGFEVKNNEN